MSREPFSPQGTVEGLPGEFKEFQVFFADGTTEVVTKGKENSPVSVLAVNKSMSSSFPPSTKQPCSRAPISDFASEKKKKKIQILDVWKTYSLFVQVLHHVHALEPVQLEEPLGESSGHLAVHLAPIHAGCCRLGGVHPLAVGRERFC